MGSEAQPTWKTRWSDALLNVPAIAVIVIGGVVLTFVANLWLKVSAVYGLYSAPESHYAQELADEYYLELAEEDCRREAQKVWDRLISLAEKQLDEAVRQNPSLKCWHREDEKCRARSTSIGAGFSPDNVVFCRSVKNKGKWTVGFDLQDGQGEALETLGRGNEIMKHLKSLRGEPDVDWLLGLLKEADVQFYDSVTYKSLYGHPLLPK